MLIGLSGTYAAGKGAIAEYLQKKSFYYYSLSDAIREEALANRVTVTRENLILLGNSLRKNFGASVLAERVAKRLEHDKNYVIDSIRNPAEAEFFRRRGDFFLVFVDADEGMRFRRIIARDRENDPKTIEELRRFEDMENSDNEFAQQLSSCRKAADAVVLNESTLEELYAKIDLMLGGLSLKFERPSWDEYFMGIASKVALRSNCIKRKVAALIVKDKRIISTGYNGTPRNTKNCYEGGCPRCNSFADAGAKLEECICSHGEENAIVQAAYHGISIKDSTLYSTFCPCLVCAKMIINSGIKRVIYSQEYPISDLVANLFKEAGVELMKI